MTDEIKACDDCARAVVFYAGGVERLVIDGVKHWRPKTVWKGTGSNKKVDLNHPRPIFCVAGVPAGPGDSSAKPHSRKEQSIKAEMIA